jgi:hypothetical protein
MWDKSRAQQASCCARHVLMGLHCLISLKLFFPPQLSLSATSFFSVLYTYFDPIPYFVLLLAGQPDGQAGWPEEGTILGLPDRHINEFTLCLFFS